MALTRKCAEAEMISRRSPAWRWRSRQRTASAWMRGATIRATKSSTAPAISAGVRPAMGARLKSM